MQGCQMGFIFYGNYAHLDVFFVKTVSRTCKVAKWDTVFTKMCENNVQMCAISIKNESHFGNVHEIRTVSHLGTFLQIYLKRQLFSIIFSQVVTIVLSILMKNDVLAKITFIVSNVRWNSRAPAVLLSRSVEKSVDARRDGFPDSAQVGPSGSGNLSPFGNGFKFCSRTFSTGLLGDIIFPSVSGKTWTSFQLFLLDYSERLFFQVFPERLGQVFNFFYWTTRRDYFSKCFRKDLDKFSTFSIGLLGDYKEFVFPSVCKEFKEGEGYVFCQTPPNGHWLHSQGNFYL